MSIKSGESISRVRSQSLPVVREIRPRNNRKFNQSETIVERVRFVFSRKIAESYILRSVQYYDSPGFTTMYLNLSENQQRIYQNKIIKACDFFQNLEITGDDFQLGKKSFEESFEKLIELRSFICSIRGSKMIVVRREENFRLV